MINPSTTGIVALQSVTVGQSSKLHDANSTAAFPRQSVFLVLDLHHFLTEGAFVEVKVQTVHRDDFWEQHGFKLHLSLMGISEHKTAFLAGMSVQVDINFNLAILGLLLDGLLYSPNRRLVLWTRVNVVAVQVLGHGI